MAINKEALESHFNSKPKEKSIAANFDEGFDIGFGTVKEEMSIWFAAPHNRTKERFGFQKEVLVVYNPFPKTDARVLKAIDSTLKVQEFKSRLEKVIFILVHNGDKKGNNRIIC